MHIWFLMLMRAILGWGQIQLLERSVINHTGFRAFESDPEISWTLYYYMFKVEVVRQFFDP